VALLGYRAESRCGVHCCAFSQTSHVTRCWTRQALGQRNRVESEKEVRKIKKKELESLINDKKALLDRLQLQVDLSSLRVVVSNTS
jgi:hypothetical protein